MKKVDLDGEGERAFVYGPNEKVVQSIDIDSLQYMQSLLGQGVSVINTVMRNLYKQPVDGIYIAATPSGKVLNTVTTSASLPTVIRVLEFTLEKLREANKSETN